MIKRILLIVAVLMPLLAKAQLAVGEWKVYTTFANEITKMLDTPDKVYYLSEGCLFSYDKETDESYSYSSANKLSDNNISSIYYNKNNKYLFVAYTSGNIDLLYDNGEIINMSDIKDASLTSSKNINDVAFYDNRIYVATAFGLVIYDDQKHQVIESGIYEKDIVCLDIVGKYIVLCYNYTLYMSPIDIKHNLFDKFTKITGANAFTIKAVNDNKALIRVHDGKKYLMWLMTFDFSNNKYISRLDLGYYDSYDIYDIKETIFSYNKESVAFIDNEGNISTTILPTELQGKTIAMWNGLNSIWAGDSNGIGNYNIEDESMIIKKDVFKPESITLKNINYLNLGLSGKIYLSNSGASRIFGNNLYDVTQVNVIKNGSIINVSPVKITINNKNNPGSSGTKMYSAYNLCEDPNNEDSYYIGSFWEGLYKITNREEENKFDWTNSNFSKVVNYSCQAPAIAFDKNKNMWVLQAVENNNNPVLHFLSYESTIKDKIEVSDWVSKSLGDFIGAFDNRILICEKSNIIFFSDGTYNSKLVAYDTKGTYDNLSDDDYLIWESFIDQDGKTFSPIYISSLCEDENGRIWIGTKSGVIEITNASNAMNKSMTINRIKVPRNDGTQLADYLLDNLQVTSISVDNSNRKWISTSTSGVYLVRESGDEIIEHFTAENSQLPSNRVYSVLSDPNSNSVFIGTDLGLAEYSSTSSPSQDDYSNVYAYPNPVRPEYTGWITIKGLMENSLVKIADAAGNVFYTAQSEGGMVTWDGCNTNGQRVKTGVYYVFASQGQEGEEKTGAVTKILVVN